MRERKGKETAQHTTERKKGTHTLTQTRTKEWMDEAHTHTNSLCVRHKSAHLVLLAQLCRDGRKAVPVVLGQRVLQKDDVILLQEGCVELDHLVAEV